MGFSSFLKKNAGAFSSIAGTFGGTYGQLAATGFGAVDAREQEKQAAAAALRAKTALAEEERRRAAALSGLGTAPRSSLVSLFAEEGELGSMLPKGIPPVAALGIGVVLLVVLLRR